MLYEMGFLRPYDKEDFDEKYLGLKKVKLEQKILRSEVTGEPILEDGKVMKHTFDIVSEGITTAVYRNESATTVIFCKEGSIESEHRLLLKGEIADGKIVELVFAIRDILK